ncbi:hypothetical protein LUZ60_011705 [Juncus effusus]|nr:hypothetical protein LUZ60_011705 [Juncus effusus]
MESWKPKSKEEPSFVKVLLDESFASQLTVPKEDITDLNGGKFWKSIFLKGLISEKLHKIEVEFSDLSITLTEGWTDFVEKNTIQRNYVLLFCYEEMNLFNVIICDKTGKRIREKRGSENEEETEVTIGLNEGCFRNNFEIGGASRKSGKRKELSDSESCSEMPKKGRIEEEIQEISSSDNDFTSENEISLDTAPKTNKGKNIVTSDSETEESESSDTDSASSDSDSSESDSSMEIIVKRAKREFRIERIMKSNRRPITDEEKYSAKRKAEKFKSKNPKFIKEMKKYNVYKDFNVMVPIKFAREFFQKTKSTKVVLKLAENEGSKNDGKRWSVNCHYTFSNNQDQWRLISGWKDFSLKNNLEESDWCVFELTKRETKNNGEEKFEFTVHIFRVVEKIVKLVESRVRKYNNNDN